MSQGFKLAIQDGNYAAGEHDIMLDNVGRLVVVSGQDKLMEDVQKILFTEQNYFYSQYGTSLNSFIGSKTDVETVKQDLAQRIINSLVYYQMLQQGQAKYQTLDAAETLTAIKRVGVTYMGDISNDEDALTTFHVEVVLVNGAGSNLQVSSYVSNRTGS